MESQSETTQTVSALKLPVLKTGDYDLWSMRMEQYLTHTDYALWEVIVNGDAPAIASASAGTEGPIPPKTAEQKLARKNELKAKSTLLLAIPDEHLLKFHGIKDAKTLWEAIKARDKPSSSTYAGEMFMLSFFANQSKFCEKILQEDRKESNFHGKETVGLIKDKGSFQRKRKENFSEAGDSVRIYPDGVVIFNENKLGSVNPTKTVADAKVSIQEMAEYFQKWHNGTSSNARSTKTSDGLAAIQAHLNNLGREIKKVNEKVYAA
ncbi:hypothetical protein Tco_0255717 [Tanacetum coccineum]